MSDILISAGEVVGAIGQLRDEVVGTIEDLVNELHVGLPSPEQSRQQLIAQITCAMIAGGAGASDDGLTLERQDYRAALVLLAGLLADQVVAEAAGRGPTQGRPKKS